MFFSLEAKETLNITGSSVAVTDALTLNAAEINITAGVEESSSHSSSQTNSAGGSFSSNGNSFSANGSTNSSESDSYSKTHIHSLITAGSLNSTSERLNIKGGDVEIQNDINITTKELTIASVQDESRSSSSSSGFNISGGGQGISSINPSSVGGSYNESNSDSKWVNNQSSLIGGLSGNGQVTITADKTVLTGALLASATRNEDGSLSDNGNLNLTTEVLEVNNLYDHNTSDSRGINLSVGTGWSGDNTDTPEKEGYASGSSTLGLNHSGHNTQQTSFATLGGGTVQKKDGTAHDVSAVNSDLNTTQEITKDQDTGGLNASFTLDHRLTSEEGRAAIAADAEKTKELAIQAGQAVAEGAQYAGNYLQAALTSLPEEDRAYGASMEAGFDAYIMQNGDPEVYRELLTDPDFKESAKQLTDLKTKIEELNAQGITNEQIYAMLAGGSAADGQTVEIGGETIGIDVKSADAMLLATAMQSVSELNSTLNQLKYKVGAETFDNAMIAFGVLVVGPVVLVKDVVMGAVTDATVGDQIENIRDNVAVQMTAAAHGTNGQTIETILNASESGEVTSLQALDVTSDVDLTNDGSKVLTNVILTSMLGMGIKNNTGAAGNGGSIQSAEVANSAESQLAKNKAAGDAFENQVMGQLQQTQSGVVQQVTVRTQSGTRTRIDLMGRDANGNIVCTECKASATAPLTTNQRAAFPEIQQSGAVVVGKGKPGFSGGTQIPPTTVNIVRP